MDGFVELFSVPINGGDSARLNSSLPEGLPVSGGHQISPNSDRVVYRVSNGDNSAIYSVAIFGSESVRLSEENGAVVGQLTQNGFQISSDGQQVIFRSIEDVEGFIFSVNQIFSVPILGGEITRLNNDLPMFSEIDEFQISSESQYVVYLGDQDFRNQQELYSVRVDTIDELLCFPIKTKDDDFVTICL